MQLMNCWWSERLIHVREGVPIRLLDISKWHACLCTCSTVCSLY